MRHRQEDLLARPRPELTLESSVPYLLDLGLLDRGTLVQHGLRIEEVAGRNRNLRVLGGPGRTFFLKQAPRGEIGADGPLALEAALYHWVATDAAAAGVRRIFPRRRHYDPERSILVLDLVTGASPLPPAEDQGSPHHPAAWHPLVATALAECHALASRLGAGMRTRLPEAAPWVFDLARPAPASLRELAPAQVDVIRAVQSHPGVLAALDRLRHEWRPTGLIHGDYKWNNVLLQCDGAGVPAGVVLLDWELAQLGDPAWDIGGALHALITEAVLEMELTDGTGPDAAAARLGAVIPGLHAAHREFWTSYLASARLTDPEASALLDRLPGHVATRLLKSAYEWSQAEAVMPRSAAAILQLGINMLLSPDAALEVVLGLGGRGSVAV
jgi:hypothetical protein